MSSVFGIEQPAQAGRTVSATSAISPSSEIDGRSHELSPEIQLLTGARWSAPLEDEQLTSGHLGDTSEDTIKVGTYHGAAPQQSRDMELVNIEKRTSSDAMSAQNAAPRPEVVPRVRSESSFHRSSPRIARWHDSAVAHGVGRVPHLRDVEPAVVRGRPLPRRHRSVPTRQGRGTVRALGLPSGGRCRLPALPHDDGGRAVEDRDEVVGDARRTQPPPSRPRGTFRTHAGRTP